MKALLSVFDKSGVVDFARDLQRAGADLISTGGTHQTLADAGLPVQQVSDFTGSPEILGGRVKTLHPAIHGGILARRDDPGHVSELAGLSMETIDVVAVNLYPFAATIARPGVTLDDALENIDIGGPTMIRAAAKNFPFVAVVVDPADYAWVAEKLAGDGLSLDERRRLAHKAFQHVAYYDTLVSHHICAATTLTACSRRSSHWHTTGFSSCATVRTRTSWARCTRSHCSSMPALRPARRCSDRSHRCAMCTTCRRHWRACAISWTGRRRWSSSTPRPAASRSARRPQRRWRRRYTPTPRQPSAASSG